MIILQEKPNHNFNNMTRKDMYKQLYEQYKKGFMIIPSYLEVVYAREEDLDVVYDNPDITIPKDNESSIKEKCALEIQRDMFMRAGRKAGSL